MIYGYARVSTKTQKIERQIKNIIAEYPTAVLYAEAFTGTKIVGRKELEKLLKVVHAGDTIVFDEVSRMSRNAEEGIQLYEKLMTQGIELVFLKQHHIDTATYKAAVSSSISVTGDEAIDAIVQGINKALRILRRRQIEQAFAQAQAEVDHLHNRTREGMAVNGAGEKISEKRTGKRYAQKKEEPAKKQILEKCRTFGKGNLTDRDCMKLTGISAPTFYKYKRELLEELNKQQ